MTATRTDGMTLLLTGQALRLLGNQKPPPWRAARVIPA